MGHLVQPPGFAVTQYPAQPLVQSHSALTPFLFAALLLLPCLLNMLRRR
jgi:hypothetical protein